MVSPIPWYQVRGEEEVSFAAIDFRDELDGEKPYASGGGDTAVEMKVWAIPWSNCAANPVLAE
jgi:hypothetical protein